MAYGSDAIHRLIGKAGVDTIGVDVVLVAPPDRQSGAAEVLSLRALSKRIGSLRDPSLRRAVRDQAAPIGKIVGVVKICGVVIAVGRLPQIAKIVVVIGCSGDVNIAGIK